MAARVVMTTAPSAEAAESIVTALISENLIACANIIPSVTSIYRWQGTVERATEVLVIIKTTEAAAGAVTQRIVELHPYDVPEVITLPVTGGYDAYLHWIHDSVAKIDD